MLHWGQLLIIWHWNDEKLSFLAGLGSLGFQSHQRMPGSERFSQMSRKCPADSKMSRKCPANVPQAPKCPANVPQMSRKRPAGSKMSGKCPANVLQMSRKYPANVSRRLGHIFLVQSSRRAEISVLKASRPILFRYWNFSVEVPLTRSAVVATKPLE